MGRNRAATVLLLGALLLTTAAAQTYSTADECAAGYMKQYNLSDVDAKAKCSALFSSPTPLVTPAVTTASPVAASPTAIPVDDCIALSQKEKGLGYDEAKKLCYAMATSSATPVAAPATAASGFNVEGCVEKHVLGGLSKEEATKTCASMAATAASPARVARAEPPKSVRAEVAEKLKERVTAARSALGACVEEVKDAVEACVKAGKNPRQCREESAARVQEACKRPDLASAPAGACASPCPEVGEKFSELDMKLQKLQEIRMAAGEVRATDEGGNAVEMTGGALEAKRLPELAQERAKMAQEILQVARERLKTAQERGDTARFQVAQERMNLAEERLKTALERAKMALQLPVKLAPGERLATFQHAPTGISLEKDELSIPLRSEGQVAARIRAKVLEVVGRGDSAEALIESLKIETKALEADFSAEKPTVGKILAKFDADLRDMPEGAEVRVRPIAAPAQERQRAIEDAARGRGLQVKGVAYAVDVGHPNLSVDGANVTLTVSRAWVDSQGGPEKVRIFREGDDGTKQVLETTFQGYDGDNAIFEGRSPGLSVFSLVAVEEGGQPAPQAQPAKSSPPYGLIGLVAAVGIGVAITLGLAKRPPGRMNPWLRMSMKASGELKDVENLQDTQDRGG